jgi:type IV secretion system protein VirB10
MSIRSAVGLLVILGYGAFAQAQEPVPAPTEQAEPLEVRTYVVPARTRVPLVLVNSVSTKTSEVGDRVYLQTSFPVASGNRIVIPEGSYVTATITQLKRPGRIRGRGELYVRFDTLMLRNGVTRDFRGTVSATDGSQSQMAEREGTIQAEGTKGKDAATIAGGAGQGAVTGAVIGIAGNSNRGEGAAYGSMIGAGVGATAGMIGVLLTRGNEVQLLRGTSLEMQLDRDLTFYADEINFPGNTLPPALPPPPSNREEIEIDPMLRRGTGSRFPAGLPSPF